MDYSNILDILHYKECKDKNLEKQMEKLYKICNSSLNEIIEDSFQSGFEQGMEYGRSDENFKIRGKIYLHHIILKFKDTV
ncbi:hypothetical protein AAGC94_09590 [Clostridium sporogenes]|uniref:hypothetical protein n=1 Tax=Clostridium TaxID=1485 RepID=UPI001C0EFB59|nr:hypothetical protein [Clostridium cochlearium]MBU5269466.1 hypothetical protein [Clostridium cochlearium]